MNTGGFLQEAIRKFLEEFNLIPNKINETY